MMSSEYVSPPASSPPSSFLSNNPRRSNSRYRNLDRFIPSRPGMHSHLMMHTTEIPSSTLRTETYRTLLAHALNINRTGRLSSFGNASQLSPKFKRMRYIPKSSEYTKDAPSVVDDDYSLNLLDWGPNNTLAIALNNTVHLWNDSDGSDSELLSTDYDENDHSGPVTSVKWSPDGTHIAVGFNNAEVQLWDASTSQMVMNLPEIHRSRVGSLDWNNQHILTTGSMDGSITNNDVRVGTSIIRRYRGHRREVCGLKWSASGEQLASGGSDNLVYIWSLFSGQSLHRFTDHTSPIKAVSWSPYDGKLLASGGIDDHCIKFWNTSTGVCSKSVDTGSQVSCLLWNRHEHELLSSNHDRLILWKYPSMLKLTEIHEHDKRILHMTQSPDGYKVASLGADEKLKLWNVFGVAGKSTFRKSPRGTFDSFAGIR